MTMTQKVDEIQGKFVDYVKCQAADCGRIATWKAGTWWFCDDHITGESIGLIKIQEEWSTIFGSTYRHGPCKAKDYWSGEYQKELVVQVLEEEEMPEPKNMYEAIDDALRNEGYGDLADALKEEITPNTTAAGYMWQQSFTKDELAEIEFLQAYEKRYPGSDEKATISTKLVAILEGR